MNLGEVFISPKQLTEGTSKGEGGKSKRRGKRGEGSLKVAYLIYLLG
jgi:hypothetical protein